MKFKTPTEAFEMLYHDIKAFGEDYAGTKALFNQCFTIELPEEKVITTPQRKFNKDYADYEWEWYLKGDRDANDIAERAKIWKMMMVPDTRGEVNSNYGYFWNYNDQLDRVIKDLKRNKETRRAIVVHYDLNELDRYQFDTPCNDVLNFYVRDGYLDLTVFARSIDLVFGFCNDQYTFAKLMELVSKETGYPVGEMHWMITNLHIYPRHYNMFSNGADKD
jgi:thymidylate synthase